MKEAVQSPSMIADELPGSPPDRDIEFTIDLAPGTELVSKAPYRMTEEEHAELLRIALEILRKEQLYAFFWKCKFWWKEVQFQGYIIIMEGIKVDPAKTEAVLNWDFLGEAKDTDRSQKFLEICRLLQKICQRFCKNSYATNQVNLKE
ncbi:uncharacterized protein LOC141714084 [Apium graveolens]|uniref:uncharacterized protein LOC141714084 n=1 Tax=Apium graveolens TaxID=4045 RepID=UPI003D7C12E4